MKEIKLKDRMERKGNSRRGEGEPIEDKRDRNSC
jgi:hypothetical protein